MPGLLDFLSSPDAQFGLGLLGAAAPRAGGVNFGQGLQEALGYVDKQRQMKAAEMAQAQEIEYKKALMAEHQQKQAMQAAAMAQAERKQQAMSQIFRPASQGAPAMNMDSMLPAELQTGLPSIGAVSARPASIDVQKGLEVGMTADELMKMDGLRNIGMNEVARTVKGMQGGREVEQQFDKFGRPVGESMEQFKAPLMVDRGGQIDAVSPYTAPGQSFGKTMTFADRNSAGNLSLAQQKFQYDKAQGDKPQFIESLGGFADPRTQRVMPARDMQGNPIAGNGPKMTEDQSKASGWLAQATNAFGNMEKATKANPGAAEPGFNDVLASIPSFGFTSGVANMMRGSTRQQFLQGASSLSEALLRAATGAGVNRDEALQKVRELTPQIGDSEAVIKQKKDAIPMYIESLKVRAGPGAKKVSGFMDAGGGGFGANQSDPLGLFTRP